MDKESVDPKRSGARFEDQVLVVDVAEGVYARMRIMCVDFREDSKVGENKVFIVNPGFPGFSRPVREAIVRQNLNNPQAQNDLDYDLIEKAKKEKGIVFLVEMKQMPFKNFGEPTFLWDSEAVVRAIESNFPINFKENVKEVTLTGYSNGAAEATAQAIQLCKNKKIEKITVRAYSLVGILPIPNMVGRFWEEAVNIFKREVAGRLQSEAGQEIDPVNTKAVEIIRKTVTFLVGTNNGWDIFSRHFLASKDGEGGSLQILLDLLNKLTEDLVGMPDWLQKCAKGLPVERLNTRVRMELVLPKHDLVAKEAVARLHHQGEWAIDPNGKMWRKIFPNVGELWMGVVGEDMRDPKGSHVGPSVIAPMEYREAKIKRIK